MYRQRRVVYPLAHGTTRKVWERLVVLGVGFLLVAQTLVAPMAAIAATIQTDLFVYQNGDTVTVTGDGFGASETVDLVTTDPAVVEVDRGSAATDDQGGFSYQFTLNATVGGLYTVNASGATSGLSASTQFDPPNLSVSPTSSNFGSTGVGLSSSQQTFTVSNSDTNANNAVVASSDGNFVVSQSFIDVPKNGSATFTVTFSPKTFGSHSATISITPGNGTGASATVSGTTPTARTTQTSLSCLPLSSVIGAASTCTATVMDNNSGSKTLPTGSVAWSASPTGQGSFDSTACSLAPINGNSASCSVNYTPTSPTGNRTITATYADHGDHSGSNGSATFAVVSASTSLSVAVASGSYGGTVNLSATLTASGSPLSAKTVGFTLNGSSVGSAVTDASGVATVLGASLGAINAGSYSTGVGASFAGDSSFSASSGSANLTVNKAPLTVTADSKSKPYGTTNPALTATFTGFQNGQTLSTSGVTGSPSLTTTATTGSGVGSYTITAAQGTLTAPNYSFAFVNGTLTVTTASLIITADPKTKAYGVGVPALTVSYSGFVNGDTAASLTTQPAVSTPATASSHVGSYTITASGAVDSNYTISYVGGTLSVTPVPLTITADSNTKLYGAAFPTLTASYSGFVNGDTPTSLTTPPALSTTATAASHVSGNPFSITATGAVDADYTISYVPGTLTVTPVSLTITADNKTKAYGAALPALIASYAGFVNGDTSASLTTPPTLSTTATAASHIVGNPFPITASGAIDTDYTISYVDGTLTVTPVPLTITADSKTKAYGGALPVLTASYSGFVNGDASTSLSVQPTVITAANLHSAVGTYPISASGAVDADYTITYMPGVLTVGAVTLTITADAKSKAYGAALPALTVSYSGFVNGDTAASLTTQPAITTSATATSHVSSYTITASGAVDSNYTINYVDGTLSVTRVPLTITADNKTKAYGAALTALTASYSGFVNGDAAASLTTQPTITTTATASSHVSGNPYAITASGALDNDYTISYVPGTLTVTPVDLTITADSKTKAYGAALPTLTVSYLGLVNGDTAASLTTQPTLATTAIAASHVSDTPYGITASGAVDSDYSISYFAGGLTVTRVPLTIAADNQTKAYGAALPTLTASYAGLVNGDTAASMPKPPTVSTTATAASHVAGNPYPITAAGAIDSDYTITYVDGTLKVTPVALTITADNKTKDYGAALPPLIASYAGFVNSDTAASLSTAPTLSTSATAASHVVGNPFSITVSGAVDADYTISYVPGALTVTPVALTITADNQTKAYGAALPPLTASYSGFINGDAAASLTTQPTLSTAATAASHVSGSSYAITADGAMDTDYTIGYVAGTLSVTPVGLTITADSKTKAYGAALPTLTVSYSGLVNGDRALTFSGDPNTPPTTMTTASPSSHQGTYAISASGAVDTDYTISYEPGTLTVTPIALTITADSKSKDYGADLPALTASYTGFANGDTAASLTTAPTLSTTAAATSHVVGNPYSITASGAVDTDYTISYVPGTLTVAPVALTITVDSESKAYGAVLPALTASYAGLVNGDTSASLTTPPTLSTTATAASHASGSPYPITADGAMDTDYTIGYAAGTLSVTPVGLTITADNQTKAYGASLPPLTASYEGFVNGDTAASLTTPPKLITTATQASHVSGNPYSITGMGAVDADYTISYAPGRLTVTPVTLTITADNKSKAYGADLPALTASYTGFAYGDTAASLTTAPTLSTTAAATSHVAGNPYSITVSGAVDADYTISYVPGNLTVTPVTLTVTADNKTMLLNAAALPGLTVSYSGFVTGDSAASLTTQPAISTTATTTSPIGTYTITASSAVDTDYAIGYHVGTLSIVYAGSGTCAGDASHVILQPINTDGTSVFKQGSTVPAKFRVCDANGKSIGDPGVVQSFVATYMAGTSTGVNETIVATTPDTAFRWDATGQQWIFNVSTKNLSANRTYIYVITLNDGSTITFRFGLK